MDEFNKNILFHKKFGFYLQNLILLKYDELNQIEYYSNYNKIDIYKYDINNNLWSFIKDGVKDLKLNII